MKLSVAPRSLVLLEYVLLSIVWNWCNNCAWASFLPRANVQTSYVRPTISFLPKTFSHARSLSPRPTHTLRIRCGPPPICFAGYYEISLQEGERGKKQKKQNKGSWPLRPLVLCSTLFNWTLTNQHDATAPLNPAAAPSITVSSAGPLMQWVAPPLLPATDLMHVDSDLLQDYFKGSIHSNYQKKDERRKKEVYFWLFSPGGIQSSLLWGRNLRPKPLPSKLLLRPHKWSDFCIESKSNSYILYTVWKCELINSSTNNQQIK